MIARAVALTPRNRARLAGAGALLALLAAALAGGWLQDGPALAAGLLALTLFVPATLLFYSVFRAVDGTLALLAVILSFVGLSLQASRLSPNGADFAVFHGLYCLLLAYLMLRARFVPRLLGLPMALAGLGWLGCATPRLVALLAPYNLAAGFGGEGLAGLWLLLFAVDAGRWSAQAGPPAKG